MGRPKEPKPAKLFMSLIASGDEVLREGLKDLSLDLGEIDFKSPRMPFHFTGYYNEEMGKDLFRHFITFKNLMSIPLLADIKQSTSRLEAKYATVAGDRRLNIDPGYICLEHIILATTKGYSHRPYLRDGIYADLTLIYRNKSFQPLEWTYPDYRQEEVVRLFNQFRQRYAEDLKGGP
jgi:hypothetical protein